MVSKPGVCFVITGDDTARFVRPGPDDRPHTVRTLDALTLRQGSENPASEIDPLDFARFLAERINEDFAADLFTDLVVVAAASILHRLLRMIVVPHQATLTGHVAPDLVDLPDHALAPHLRRLLRSGI